MEARANRLWKESLQCLTIALAGSDTKKFWDLLIAFFGANHKGDETDDPWYFFDAAPAIPPSLPLMETETEDETMSVKLAPAPSSVPKISVKRKPASISQTKDLLDELCMLQEAIQMYPADENSIEETGIPTTLLVKGEHQTTHAGASVYLCPDEKCQTPPFYAQGLAAVYSHIRRKHLSLALACPYCANKVFWNSCGWKSHMDSKHSKVPHCGISLHEEVAMAQEILSATQQAISIDAPPSIQAHHYKSWKSSSEDSSQDCSDGSDTSTSRDESAPPTQTKSLTSQQGEAIVVGATALVTHPSEKALIHHPTGMLAPCPKVVQC